MREACQEHSLDYSRASPPPLASPPLLPPLGATATHLGGKTLEERAETLLLDHLLDDSDTRDVGVEVGVLDTGLDDVEGGGNGDRGNSAHHGRDEVCGQHKYWGKQGYSLWPQVACE